MDTKSNPPHAVDPDPFTIASTFIAAGSFILQLIHHQRSSRGPRKRAGTPQRAQMLDHLESQVDQLDSKSDRLIRAIERGSSDSEMQFYEAPVRIGQTSLELGHEYHQQFQNHLADVYVALANTSRWINHIIREDPDLADRLGANLELPLAKLDVRLNRILAEGLSSREAVAEGKAALRALHDAIQKELGRRN